MKLLRYAIGISLLVLCLAPFTVRAADDPMVFDSTDGYIGACAYTATSTWTLTQDLTISKFQVWYKWQAGETSLPVTVTKDGQDFASFTAVRGTCDPYQATWCNADYAINRVLPAGTYTTTIATAYQCLKPGGTGTVRLYGTTGTTAVTIANATVNASDTAANVNTNRTPVNANTNAISNTNNIVTSTTNTVATEECGKATTPTALFIIIGVLVVIIFVLIMMVMAARKSRIVPGK
jgi:hypothetical protein